MFFMSNIHISILGYGKFLTSHESQGVIFVSTIHCHPDTKVLVILIISHKKLSHYMKNEIDIIQIETSEVRLICNQ